MFQMFIIFALVFNVVVTEARVFCQDNNATPWKRLGYPCPITCSTIITAVDRLKITDYQYLVHEKKRNRINMSAVDLYTIGQQLQENIVYGRRSNALDSNTKNHLKLYNTYHRLLYNEDFLPALKRESKEMTVYLNRTCSKMAAKEYFMKKTVRFKCTRKLYNKIPEVLQKFTKFLNRYADPKYQFDEQMAEMILQKLEGNLALRYGVVDFKRILSYMTKALQYHKSKTKGKRIIKLQTKNCMTLYVPGCYCKTGFVENQGQCVKPEDCMSNSMFTEYLERIILY